jgi:thiol-disulfide isomerase/thioredoxin
MFGGTLSPLSAQEIRVSGSLDSDESLEIIATRLMLSSAQPWAYEMFTVPADEFELIFEADDPIYLVIRGSEFQLLPLLLEPGIELHLTSGPETGMTITGTGVEGPAYLVREQPQRIWQAAFREGYGALQEAGGEFDMEAYMARADSLLAERNSAVRSAGLSAVYTRVLEAENLANALRLKSYALEHVDAATAEALDAAMLEQAMNMPGGDTLSYAWRYTEELRNLLNARYQNVVRDLGGETSDAGYYYFQKGVLRAPNLRRVLLAGLVDQLLKGDYGEELAAVVEDFRKTEADGLYGAYIEGRAREREAMAPGQMAPEISAATLSGEPINTEDLRGSVVLVTAWGSWCGWSKAELPHLVELQERLAEEDVIFLNLGWETEETGEASWREAIASVGLGGVNVLSDEALRSEWGLVKTPTFILLDRDGRIVTNDPPRPSREDGAALEAALRELLAGGPRSF